MRRPSDQDHSPLPVLRPSSVHDVDLIQEVIRSSHGRTETETEAQAGDGRLPLNVGVRDLARATPAAWEAVAANNEPPRLYVYGDQLIRLQDGIDAPPTLRALQIRDLRHELTRAAWCFTERERQETLIMEAAYPPRQLLEDMLATPNPPVPRLSRLVYAPVFGSNGELETEPGYHSASRTYYVARESLAIPPVSAAPAKDQIGRARDLLSEMLSDFPFVEPADAAHAWALLLLPFVRDLIAGPTPNHLIEAPQAGTGKGLLAATCLLPSNGTSIGTMSQPRSEEEWRKRITSVLRAGHAAVLLDNVRDELDSGVLAAALTATMWEDRLLGGNTIARLPIRCVWVTTGNNPMLSTEIARRCIRIRLDAGKERPWERPSTEFRHPDLLHWAESHRADLIWSALTLIRAWMAQGRPVFTERTLGSFEEWTRVIGGILDVAGVPGFLGNLDALYERADVESGTWRQLFGLWLERFGDQEVPTREILLIAAEIDTLKIQGRSDHARGVSLGKLLSERVDRVVDGHRLTVRTGAGRHSLWRLTPVSSQAK